MVVQGYFKEHAKAGKRLEEETYQSFTTLMKEQVLGHEP